MSTINTCNPQNVIVNTYASCNSLNGTFFFGKSELLTFGNGVTAIAVLQNPITSGAYIYLNGTSFTNVTATPFLAKFWYFAATSGNLTISTDVICPNTTIVPTPIPRAEILYAAPGTVIGGVNPIMREVPGYTTILREDTGETILAPGEYLIITLETNDPTATSSAYVTFGWWEAF